MHVSALLETLEKTSDAWLKEKCCEQGNPCQGTIDQPFRYHRNGAISEPVTRVEWRVPFGLAENRT